MINWTCLRLSSRGIQIHLNIGFTYLAPQIADLIWMLPTKPFEGSNSKRSPSFVNREVAPWYEDYIIFGIFLYNIPARDTAKLKFSVQVFWTYSITNMGFIPSKLLIKLIYSSYLTYYGIEIVLLLFNKGNWGSSVAVKSAVVCIL